MGRGPWPRRRRAGRRACRGRAGRAQGAARAAQGAGDGARGDPQGPRAVSLIAIHQHGIPDVFPDRVLEEARAPARGAGGRRDLRDLPLVTIDPEDARDRDDAVPRHPRRGPGATRAASSFGSPSPTWPSTCGPAARSTPRRGCAATPPTSPTACADAARRAVGGPVLAPRGVDRAVVAVRMRIDRDGRKLDHAFVRG
jgi:ribonuclease R